MNKMIHECIHCHGSGWHDTIRKYGCFRCGGLQYPSKQGSGIDPLSNALCILDKVFPDWIDTKTAIQDTMVYTGWTRDLVVKYLNWMYTEGLLVVIDGKAIDNGIYQNIIESEVEQYEILW